MGILSSSEHLADVIRSLRNLDLHVGTLIPTLNKLVNMVIVLSLKDTAAHTNVVDRILLAVNSLCLNLAGNLSIQVGITPIAGVLGTRGRGWSRRVGNTNAAAGHLGWKIGYWWSANSFLLEAPTLRVLGLVAPIRGVLGASTSRAPVRRFGDCRLWWPTSLLVLFACVAVRVV